MTDCADTFYVPFNYLPCSFISAIEKDFATKISVVEGKLSALDCEKEAEVQNSKAKKNSAKRVGTKPAFETAKKLASPLEQHKNEPREFDPLDNSPNSDNKY